MTLQELNTSDSAGCQAELFKCCGSSNWARQLCALRPFQTKEDLLQQSDRIWNACTDADAMEAFSHHPPIGDLKNLEKKFADTKEWAGGEQAGVNAAGKETLQALAEGNALYEKRFGYIFIVCASGKSAQEMLDLLTARLHNNAETERMIARAEQNKITHLRIHKLLA
ncbi:MAG TPA: 2-oxo-4-hydroxy-4-carboxy-5-ureidoimidazoline decarboxylase [Bacteroidia bacterium]|jgi:2-oxo-4-hydroxy-4-carboxy-5-ureidoimidazoline decarboxylase|nr:2-oxo-4-hydroxy-4-carboxy-5-ureidoimidazoline decarboxylase [Bacteroidia bacterium]